MNVLILDDDKNICEYIKLLVTEWGYNTVTFQEINPAITHFMNNDVDVAIVDYYLNDDKYNGCHVINFLKSKKHISCILITGKVTTEGICNAFDYLIDKTVMVEELKKALDELNDKSLIQSQLDNTVYKEV